MKKGLLKLLSLLDDDDREQLGLSGRTKLSLPEVEELPTTSQAAIRIFEERYLDGTSLPLDPIWASELGEVTDLSSPYATFPMSLLALKFQESKGENRFETVGERSFDMKPVEFDEGIQMPLVQIQTNVFAQRKWIRGPELLRRAEARHVAQNIATNVIDANPACGWDNVALFSAAHLVNPRRPDLGVFSNLESVGTDMTNVDNITAEIAAMMTDVVDENGSKLIQQPRFAILASTNNFQAIANLMKQDKIVKAILNEAGTDIVAAGSQNNPYEGLIDVVLAPQWDGGFREAVLTGQTVSVSSGAKTYTRSAGSFLTDGLSVGDTVEWSGFSNADNNGPQIITTLTATVMTCAASSLTTENTVASTTCVSGGEDTLLIDRNLVDEMMPPWLAGRWAPGGSLELRVYDEATDYFRNTGNIAISNHIWWGFGAVFPHAVRYITGPK
jgi:hypothetical protein